MSLMKENSENNEHDDTKDYSDEHDQKNDILLTQSDLFEDFEEDDNDMSILSPTHGDDDSKLYNILQNEKERLLNET